jgi:hypothetical protein
MRLTVTKPSRIKDGSCERALAVATTVAYRNSPIAAKITEVVLKLGDDGGRISVQTYASVLDPPHDILLANQSAVFTLNVADASVGEPAYTQCSIDRETGKASIGRRTNVPFGFVVLGSCPP